MSSESEEQIKGSELNVLANDTGWISKQFRTKLPSKRKRKVQTPWSFEETAGLLSLKLLLLILQGKDFKV